MAENRMKSILKKIAPFISVLFFGLAIWFLDRELGQYAFSEVTGYIGQIPPLHMVWSLVLCGLSYLLLTGYDALGVEYIKEDLAFSKVAKAGFIGYAFSHNIGMALITGGSIRYRLYSSWGLNGLQVTKIVGFSAFTLWIGFCSTAGLSLLLYSPNLPDDLVPYVSLQVLGIVLLAMVAVYMVASALIRDDITVWRWEMAFPGFKMALKQVVIASVDWLLASSVLYVLLPDAGIPYFGFLGVFLLAQIVGLFSQVPGGLGVFESIMVLYLSEFISGSSVVGILLVYRIIYYLLPLLVATALLGHQEYQANRRVVREFGARTASWLPRLVPTVFSVLIFIGGAVLLFSGAMPSEVPRMHWLQPLIPLPVIEMSHFFASMVGAVMLVLAHGLQRRIDAAYHATVGVLIFGIIFSLLKGVSYVEASILAVMLAALVPARREFHRKAALFSESFSPVWITMILMVVISAVWLGFFSYRNVEYSRELWWQFTLLGDAPRYLRAYVAVLGLAILFGLVKLLHPSVSRPRGVTRQQFQRARSLMRRSKWAQSNLLLLGDKQLFFNQDKSACIMYGVKDKSWVSMGDPLGDEEEAEELVWRFRELSENNDGWPVFYQVHEPYLDLYQDLGLTILKLGEQARVPLADFEFEGTGTEAIRETRRKFTDEGYSFTLLPAGKVPSRIADLRRVSDAWLGIPGNHEKRFSLGYFNEAYLRNFPVAIVQRKGEPVAFCNIWSGARKYEVGHDLVRFRPEAPEGITDYLLAEAMRWGRDEQYRWFNLGLAPLSEIEEKKLEPRWARFADQLYDYGEHLYNFRGLRHHKEKFNPTWEPLYLAAPGGLKLPTVLADLSELISGHHNAEPASSDENSA